MITTDYIVPAICIYVGINALAFFWYAYDKSVAGSGRVRTPERVLLVLALMGPFGAFGAMQIFRHKTRKIKFWLVPVFLAVHVLVIISVFAGFSPDLKDFPDTEIVHEFKKPSFITGHNQWYQHMRTNRQHYFLDLAARCARQGTCLRRNFGAILVDEYNTIVSTGYTGAPRKQMDCTELNRCWRKEHNIPSGSNYERCRSVHAEMNALLQAGKLARGCTLYLSGFDVETEELTQIWPCFLCSKMIVNSGVTNVIMQTGPDTYKEMDPMVLYQMRSRESLGDDAK